METTVLEQQQKKKREKERKKTSDFQGVFFTNKIQLINKYISKQMRLFSCVTVIPLEYFSLFSPLVKSYTFLKGHHMPLSHQKAFIYSTNTYHQLLGFALPGFRSCNPHG